MIVCPGIKIIVSVSCKHFNMYLWIVCTLSVSLLFLGNKNKLSECVYACMCVHYVMCVCGASCA